jgi:hypothetical protein
MVVKIEEMLLKAIAQFDNEWADIAADQQRAIARAVDEKTRDAGENAQKHPMLSSTPLKEAKFRAHSAVTRLEKKYAPKISLALQYLATIEYARKFAERIDEAIEFDSISRREEDKTGLYAAACKAIDRMYEFGAGKWHWKQIGDLELKKISDLVRWKAKNPDHDDPNSPWLEVNAIYERRRMVSDLGGKLQLSSPNEPHSGFQPLKRVSQIPTEDEMRAIAEGWAQYAPQTPSDDLRMRGIGRLPTDDPYGGILVCGAAVGVLKIQDRFETYEHFSGYLDEKNWNRFEVPRSAYALVENRTAFDFPALPQLYPPLAELRLIGVTLDYSRSKLQELVAAEAGEAPSEIIIDTVQKCFLKHNRCHDEDLIRFWLFLLVGRKYPERVDALFPPGYFHGVRGPDIEESVQSPTHFQIVRVAADQDFGHMMRHPDFGPWKHLR